MEREEYEQWLASPVTQKFFKYMRDDRYELMQESVYTPDFNHSLLIKGKVQELDNLLTLNNGEEYGRFGS